MSDMEQRIAEMGRSPGAALAKQGAVHFALWLLAWCMFAAADSWQALTGWSLATLLSVLTGITAGFVTVNLAHEWSHYLGARATGARYTIADTPGLFIFDWDFEANSLSRFYTMSVTGNLGGALAVLALFGAVAPDNAGRAAVLAGAVASFALGALIEWPVLLRTRSSGDPLAELSRLTPPVLVSALLGSVVTGLLCWLLIT